MNIEETYNIHKKINCVFPFFKSKWLCKHNKHNYELHSRFVEIEYPIVFFGDEYKNEAVEKAYKLKSYWKCRCCGDVVERK